LVHLYWRGVDNDGVASRFIWTIRDTIVPPPLGWNPAARIRDLQEGRITNRTDSIFAFTAFKNIGGVGLRKNRQAFYVAAIDDNGVIDPSPEAVEFVATVSKLPELRFTTSITSIINGSSNTITKPYKPAVLDTVGMFRPFSISYNGRTTNGVVTGYTFFPLTANVNLIGAGEWGDDLSDTLRFFPNTGLDSLESGTFRLAARARDSAGAESRVDSKDYRVGVCQVVVNFEPDTRITGGLYTYPVGGQMKFPPELVDFSDGRPDTVPYGSWLKIEYDGWDRRELKDPPPGPLVDPYAYYDSVVCHDTLATRCLRYQIQYTRTSETDGGPSHGGRLITSNIRWYPENGQRTNDYATWDSTTISIGSEKYDIRVRTLDEYRKPDGSPDQVTVIGNFPPTIDSASIVNYDGTVVSDGDTIVWDWWNPANFKGNFTDTLDITSQPLQVVREFFFVVNGTGHDHPKEDGSGVKSWRYEFRRSDNPSQIERVGRSGFWRDALSVNVLSDTIRLVRRYPLFEDPGGAMNYASLPGWVNTEYDMSVRGKDFALGDVYEQYIFENKKKVRLNTFNMSSIARWTDAMGQRVYLKVKR
jgi:hypothetical protein